MACSKYKTEQSRGNPSPRPFPAGPQPSELYKEVFGSSLYPPILQVRAGPQAVPYKEGRFHRTPSESIANNYSLEARDLRVRHLRQTPRTSGQSSAKPTASRRRQAERSEGVKQKTTGASLPTRPKAKIVPSCVSREQPDIVHGQEEKMGTQHGGPSERDLERYMHYIGGIPQSMLEPLPQPDVERLPCPGTDDGRERREITVANVEEEIRQDYYFSIRKSIVDYILLDPSERQRLSISSVPKPFPHTVMPAPAARAAGHGEQRRMWLRQHLFTVSPIMVRLNELWLDSYSSLRCVRVEELASTRLPLLPSEFEEFVRTQCRAARDELAQRWLPECASLCGTYRDQWSPFKPGGGDPAPVAPQELFLCVAALMSLQLRSFVTESLRDLSSFFSAHEAGNDYGDVFDDLTYIRPQVFLVELQVNEADIDFSPSFHDCWEVIRRAFVEIVKSAENLPRVECVLFDELNDLYLRTVRPDEPMVTDLINNVKDVFHKNTVGPQKYLNVYQQFGNLLDPAAERDVSAFLKDEHSSEEFAERIESIRLSRTGVSRMHTTVPLAMFCLSAGQLNGDLCDRAEKLSDKLIAFKVEENRELNKGICQKYEEITETLRSAPATAEELGSLDQFTRKTSTETVHELTDEIHEAAAARLMFLLEHRCLSSDDITLNMRVLIHWPKQLATELTDSVARLTTTTEDQSRKESSDPAESVV